MRLLVLPFSMDKDTVAGMIPAIDRYTGIYFLTYKKWARECPEGVGEVSVYILSARFGLIPGNTPIPYYNYKMTAKDATRLKPQVTSYLRELVKGNHFASVCLPMSKLYLKAIGDIGVTPYIINARHGETQAALKAWLWHTTKSPPVVWGLSVRFESV